MVSHKIHFWFYSKPPIFFIGILFLIFNGVSLFGQIASCKSDFTIFLYGSGSAPIAVSDIDDGSAGYTTLTINKSSFTCADRGLNTITLTEDEAIPDTCTATVIVEDNIAPNVVCQNIEIQLDTSGNASILEGDIDNESTDNCGTMNLSLSKTTFNFGLNVYYTLLNIYISREPFSINGNPTIIYDGEEVETYANVNHKNAYIIGSKLSFEGKVSKLFSAKGSVTIARGMTYDTDLPSSIQPIFGDVELEFEKKRFETPIKFRFNGSKKLKEYNLVEGIDNIEQTPIDAETGGYYGTPNWNIFNFYSKYSRTKLL